MPAFEIEARTDAPELDRRAQECFAHAGAVRGEIRHTSIWIFVADGTVYLILVDEFRGEYVAVSDLFSVLEKFFEHDQEAVAASDIEGEIDIPAEYLDQLHDHLVRKPGLLTGEKQRIFNLTCRVGDAALQRYFDEFTFKTRPIAEEFQCGDVSIFNQYIPLELRMNANARYGIWFVI